MTERLDNFDARHGSPDDWVDLYGDYLYSFALLRLRSETAAEDVVQETFLAALKAREKFAGDSSVKTWLVGILKHKIVDYLRKIIREQKDVSGEDSTAGDPHFYRYGKWQGHWDMDRLPISWGKSPDYILEDKEFWTALEDCLDKLSPRMAGIFILYHLEGLSTEEICKELDISPTNLWVILHRARRQLRSCLERNWIRARGKKD